MTADCTGRAKAGQYDMPRSRKAAKNVVPAVERAFKLLELFRRETPELSLADMARRLELARSSAYRIAFTLEQMGYLKRAPSGFQLGPAILSLGFDFLASQELVDFAQPELVKLRDLTSATAEAADYSVRDIWGNSFEQPLE